MFDTPLLLSQMKRNQWLSRDDLRRISEKKLLDLLSHARTSVPFYKKSLGGIHIRSIDELESLPILTKTVVRDNATSFISSAFGKRTLQATYTSGSTGIQVPLFYSYAESAYGVAFETHHLTECGAGIFDLQVRIAHYESRPNLLQCLGVFRCRYLDVRADETENLLRLASLRPGILISYPSILLPLARINSSEGLNLRLKLALSGGETLTPTARKEISSSFSCPVFDRYGSMESSWAAWECTHGSMHVQDDMVIVEIVDGNGKNVPDGKTGTIVVTPLWRRAMPFIRYSVGDSGSFGPPCACGRGLRTLRVVRGRQDDIIVLPSGKIRSARSINLMDDIPGMLSYQIIQEQPSIFVFRYVPSGGLGDKERKEVESRIRAGCLDEKIRVEFDEVAAIPRGNTGKIQTVVSKVKADAGKGA
jgi:phenylacetate-CoA ligase